jgi:hypothetical protein
MMMQYGNAPEFCGNVDLDLKEFMYFLYLPVFMDNSGIKLPPNVECCRPIIELAMERSLPRQYNYVYLSARKGWATPDNPLNRPGWHCDGFGTDDLNFVWWKGQGTRFAIQRFTNISTDHEKSQIQFEGQVNPRKVTSYPSGGLYRITPTVVHATPLIRPPGELRQYVKISMSDHKYNLENNSHNYLFDYDWPLTKREVVRNDPYQSGKDCAA